MNLSQGYRDYEQFASCLSDNCYNEQCQLSGDAYCKPRKHKDLYDDEPGIANKIRAAERQEIELPSATDENSLGLVPTPAPIGVDCCHNEETKGRQIFTVSFGAGSVTASDECLLAQRSRCEAFWKFVDSQPELLGMIKDGEDEDTEPPKIIVEPIDQTKKSNSCKEGEALKARHQALRRAEKDRIMKRKMKMAELQAKSGQPIFQSQKLEKPKKKQEIGYTGCTDVSEIFEEMKIFDKMTKNPVLIGPRSSVDGETPPPSAVNWEEEGEIDDYVVQDTDEY